MAREFKEVASLRTDRTKYADNYENIFRGPNKKKLVYGRLNQIYFNSEANTFLIIKNVNVADGKVECRLIDIESLCSNNLDNQFQNNNNLIEVEYLNKCVATSLTMEGIK